MEQKPRQDFNALFGVKYDPATHSSISGVSQEGEFKIKRERKESDCIYFIALQVLIFLIVFYRLILVNVQPLRKL